MIDFTPKFIYSHFRIKLFQMQIECNDLICSMLYFYVRYGVIFPELLNITTCVPQQLRFQHFESTHTYILISYLFINVVGGGYVQISGVLRHSTVFYCHILHHNGSSFAAIYEEYAW